MTIITLIQKKNKHNLESNSLAKTKRGRSLYFRDGKLEFRSDTIIAGHDPTHLIIEELIEEKINKLCSCENEAITIGLTLACIPDFKNDFTLGSNTVEAMTSRMRYLLKRKKCNRPIEDLILVFLDYYESRNNLIDDLTRTRLINIYSEHKKWYYSSDLTYKKQVVI